MLARPGTLVHARGREWVVLPESSEDLLMVRPVGGLDEEVVGILPAVEPVRSAAFPLPSKADLGDFTSGRLLRDAARLSTRAAAGPFRSFGRIAVEPRPYQLVPLMMALKLDPVRLLIADDVGIGKTIEAATIARELLDRGEIRRLAVLCPPHLAEQWQAEFAQKFHIEAQLVLSSTIQRLERDLPVGVSVFDRHNFTIVSTDFIKSSRRAEDFILKCPEFVIVDEAHGCTLAGGAGKGRQLRHDLLTRISGDASRHLVLVTATPHSGNEEAFRSLLGLLDRDFLDLPHDLEKKEREGIRRKLARHLVQRRRADIRHYLDADTSFPERLDKESTYTLGDDYRVLFEDILDFARDYVSGDDGERHQRVRYWSALALLRCVSSSPAAAAATLRSRAAVDEAEEPDVEEVGRRTVLDQDAVDEIATLDFNPGSDTEDSDEATRRRLLEFARRAEALSSEQDHKLQGAIKEIKALVKDADVFSQGYRPGMIAKLGFGPDELAKVRPGIVYTSISCYGPDGPFSHRGGWEQVAQTMTGICHDNNPERPHLLPAAACDYTTGYLGAYGVMLALARRGWDVEVVPGVSSSLAVPALAGIPVTCRGISGGFAVVTGHRQGDGCQDWAAWAKADTLVVLMGVARRQQIAACLIAHGRSPDEPAAFIENGATPRERTLVTTLGDIAHGQTAVQAPAVLVIGQVVGLRAQLLPLLRQAIA